MNTKAIENARRIEGHRNLNVVVRSSTVEICKLVRTPGLSMSDVVDKALAFWAESEIAAVETRAAARAAIAAEEAEAKRIAAEADKVARKAVYDAKYAAVKEIMAAEGLSEPDAWGAYHQRNPVKR